MSFAHPQWLIGALVVTAALAFALRYAAARRTATVLAYTNLEFFERATGAAALPAWLLAAVFLFSILLITTAIAGPHIIAKVPAKDAEVVLCVDTSGSMTATDVEPSRAQAAAAAARQFIEKAPDGTKIAIVSFATAASVVQPLTSDRDAALAAVDRIPPPNGGTAIGDALALAGRMLPPQGHRVVVLITDGVNNMGVDPLQAAGEVGSRHVLIYTVGIGTNGSGQLIPGTNEPATIDEDQLTAIAQAGGGAYARAENAAQLEGTLSHLGSTTVFESKKVDASLGFALVGGLLMCASVIAGFLAGRFP